MTYFWSNFHGWRVSVNSLKPPCIRHWLNLPTDIISWPLLCHWWSLLSIIQRHRHHFYVCQFLAHCTLDSLLNSYISGDALVYDCPVCCSRVRRVTICYPKCWPRPTDYSYTPVCLTHPTVSWPSSVCLTCVFHPCQRNPVVSHYPQVLRICKSLADMFYKSLQ